MDGAASEETATAGEEPPAGLAELPPVEVELPPPVGRWQRRAPVPAIAIAVGLHIGLLAMFATELQPYAAGAALPDAVAVTLVDLAPPAPVSVPPPVPALDAPPAPAFASPNETALVEMMRGSVAPDASAAQPVDGAGAEPSGADPPAAMPPEASPVAPEEAAIMAPSAAQPKAAETGPQRGAQRPASGRAAAAAGSGAPAIIVGTYVSRARQLVVERMPRVRGIKGRVVIELVIGVDGVPERAELVERSGRNELDEFVLASVRRMRFPPPAADMTRQQRTFHAPFSY